MGPELGSGRENGLPKILQRGAHCADWVSSTHFLGSNPLGFSLSRVSYVAEPVSSILELVLGTVVCC